MSPQRFKRFLNRIVVLGLLWWVLTGGEWNSWLFGGPVIVIIAAWRLVERDAAEERIRLVRLAWFAPYFLLQSFTASCDVAWRALHWRLPIAPAIRRFAFRLPPRSRSRVFFTNCINLLPGTLAASWEGNVLQVHLLVDRPMVMAELRRMEDRVGLLFGHELASEEEPVET